MHWEFFELVRLLYCCDLSTVNMPGPNLTTLPPEMHLRIRSFLTEVDSIPLSLSSKRLYEVYSRQPTVGFSKDRFWTMILGDDYEDRKQILALWNTRLEVLALLRHWTERVTGDAALRVSLDEDANTIDRVALWEVCVGCASYKVHTDDWQDGYDFVDVISDKIALSDHWQGPDWLVNMEWRVLDGIFCKSCSLKWENLGFS